MARIAQVVGIELLELWVPLEGPGQVRIGKRHHVVDVELRRILHDFAVVWAHPPASSYPARPLVGECDRYRRLGYEDLLAGVLAVAVRICPVIPVAPVVRRQHLPPGADDNAHHDREGLPRRRCGSGGGQRRGRRRFSRYDQRLPGSRAAYKQSRQGPNEKSPGFPFIGE